MVAMRGREPPVQALTVFLLKRGTATFEDALEEPQRLMRYPLKRSLPFRGALFIAPQRTTPPRWLTFVEEGTLSDLQDLYNASTSAVLFVRAARRLLAFTFGYGRSLLSPERIDRSFGLRVVLNTVDEQGLRSVDTKTVQELTVHTRRQTSQTSRLAEFGVDKEEDLLGSVAGVPRNPTLARMVSGADALHFRARVAFEGLGDKCRTIMAAYRADDYKEKGFEFVDYVRTVGDPTVIESLDTDLVTGLASRDLDAIHMAPPEIIDWTTTEGFSFTKSADPEADLTFESFFAQIRRADELSVERLKRQRVYVHWGQAAEATPAWPVYRVLVAERRQQNRRYVLSGGNWYEIDTDFAALVESRVRRIRSGGLRLPEARPGEKEEQYNRRASTRRGIYCVDRKCPRIDGDPVELCDLYSSNRQFIHVKRWKASSTLSHLFAQGRTSAEAFLSDERFRQEARKHLRRRASSLAKHIPAGRPDPSRYQVVFAIIKGGGRGWKRTLPFFSQLQLARTAEAVRRLGFDVCLEQIKVGG